MKNRAVPFNASTYKTNVEEYQTTKNKTSLFILTVLFVLLFSYAVADFLSSRNTIGAVQAENSSRTLVYVALIACNVWSVVCLVILKIKKIPKTAQALYLLCFLISFSLLGNANKWSVCCGLSNILLQANFICLFSVLSRKKAINDKIKQYMLLLFIFYLYYYVYSLNALRAIHDTNALNSAYNVLVFWWWCEQIKRPKIRLICLALIVAAVLFSMKRGALFALAGMVFVRELIKKRVDNSGVKSIIGLTATFALLIALFFYVDYLLGGLFSARLDSEELQSGSGRAERWAVGIDLLIKSSVPRLLFGYGQTYSLNLFNSGFHNEWVEEAVSLGLVGLGVLTWFYGLLFHKCWRLIKERSELAIPFGCAIVCMFVQSLVSADLFAQWTIYVAIFLGYTEGRTYDRNLATVHEKPRVNDTRLRQIIQKESRTVKR